MDLVYAALAFAGILALTRSWPPSARLIARLKRNRPLVSAYLRSAPAVVTYTAILIVTTSLYAEITPAVGRALLRDQSTNLRHLSNDPVRVMIVSAFWTGSGSILPFLPLFVLILAPLERWLGTGRFLIAFWCGHILSTVIVAAGIWVAIDQGHAPESLSRVTDVGISYGAYCCCALFAYRLPYPYRYAWGAAWLAFALFGIYTDGNFTAYGHLVTILIGFALYPLTRAPVVRARTRDPIWQLPLGVHGTAPATSSI